MPDAAYGCVIGSAIAKDRFAGMDLANAKAAPGLLAIVTVESAGKPGKRTRNAARLPGYPAIEHYHQPVALIVAETFEVACSAASLVRDTTFLVSPGSGGPFGA